MRRVRHQHLVAQPPLVIVLVNSALPAQPESAAGEYLPADAELIGEVLQRLLDEPPALLDDALAERHGLAGAGIGRLDAGAQRQAEAVTVQLAGAAEVVLVDRRPVGIAIARRLRDLAAVEKVAQGSRVRAGEKGVRIEAAAVGDEAVVQRPAGDGLIVVAAEEVELAAATVGQIGGLEP